MQKFANEFKVVVVMDGECFKIYVEQLRDGKVLEIDEELDNTFLDVQEKELSFVGPVVVKGEAYLAGEELVLHLALKATSVVPCVICNKPVEVVISLPEYYGSVALDEIKHGIFNMSELLREEILLSTKGFAECNQGHCPERHDAERYLKKKEEGSPLSPFDALNIEEFE